jgi:hypothetical protein
MVPTFVRGLPGAEFPEKWRRFAGMFGGGPDSGAPKKLSAAAAPGIELDELNGFGWELTFD